MVTKMAPWSMAESTHINKHHGLGDLEHIETRVSIESREFGFSKFEALSKEVGGDFARIVYKYLR